MLVTVYSCKNLLILVGIAEKDKVVDGARFSKRNKNLSKFQKPKILRILFNVGTNAKAIRFLIFKTSTAFT